MPSRPTLFYEHHSSSTSPTKSRWMISSACLFPFTGTFLNGCRLCKWTNASDSARSGFRFTNIPRPHSFLPTKGRVRLVASPSSTIVATTNSTKQRPPSSIYLNVKIIRKPRLRYSSAAFDWARSRGLDTVVGPKGFTPLDGFGLLVKGFEHRPAFGLPYNPAYYVDLIEAQGFVKDQRIVSGYLGADNVNSRRAFTNLQNASPSAADCTSCTAIHAGICVNLSLSEGTLQQFRHERTKEQLRSPMKKWIRWRIS